MDVAYPMPIMVNKPTCGALGKGKNVFGVWMDDIALKILAQHT
jgi:hypothetical protein